MMLRTKPLPFSLLVVSEWQLILPATVFLAAAGLRLLQPPQYQPARTIGSIFQWTTMHVSHLGAAALVIGLPAVLAGLGCAALIRLWRRDEVLRKDGGLVLSIVTRNIAVGFLALATLLGTSILVFAVAHLITD